MLYCELSTRMVLRTVSPAGAWRQKNGKSWTPRSSMLSSAKRRRNLRPGIRVLGYSWVPCQPVARRTALPSVCFHEKKPHACDHQSLVTLKLWRSWGRPQNNTRTSKSIYACLAGGFF